MITIRVKIQAGKKHCDWCHGWRQVAKRIAGDGGRLDYCDIFCSGLEMDGRRPLRCQECLEAEEAGRETDHAAALRVLDDAVANPDPDGDRIWEAVREEEAK
jgi:hypothetical protein